jgi:predicted Zn-dependent peptidase
MVLKIKSTVRALAVLAAMVLMCGSAASAGPAGAAEFKVPVEYYKLPNGLRVVLSPDHTSPTICVGVYYRIGFRVEPRDRTGFAHLFEHMMFQGAEPGKMEFIKLVSEMVGPEQFRRTDSQLFLSFCLQ